MFNPCTINGPKTIFYNVNFCIISPKLRSPKNEMNLSLLPLANSATFSPLLWGIPCKADPPVWPKTWRKSWERRSRASTVPPFLLTELGWGLRRGGGGGGKVERMKGKKDKHRTSSIAHEPDKTVDKTECWILCPPPYNMLQLTVSPPQHTHCQSTTTQVTVCPQQHKSLFVHHNTTHC